MADNQRKTCHMCGKVFITEAHNQRYCSMDCKAAAAKTREHKRPKRKRKMNDLERISKEAMDMGMSYGKYVAKMGL